MTIRNRHIEWSRPASPWGEGYVVWLDQQTLATSPEHLHWAKHPLWASYRAAYEFPFSAWLPLPANIALRLPENYGLTDRITHDPQLLLVSSKGLHLASLTLPWQQFAPWWPTLVYQAHHIDAEEQSPLRAMALWLNKLPAEGCLPFYIPELIQTARPDDNQQLLQSYPVSQLRQQAVHLYNRQFLKQQLRPSSSGTWQRKLRKLLRDPQQFWIDSRLRKRFVT